MVRFYYFTVMALMLLGSAVAVLTPGLKPPLGVSDSFAHMFAFFVCSLLILSLRLTSLPTVLLFLLCSTFAFEIVQLFVPNRQAELSDIVFNFYGLVIAYTVWCIIQYGLLHGRRKEKIF